MDINGLGKARGQDNPEVSKTRPVNTSARDKDRPAPKEEDTNSTGCPLDLQPSAEKLSAELQLPSPRELQRYLPPALEQEHAPRSSTTQNVP